VILEHRLALMPSAQEDWRLVYLAERNLVQATCTWPPSGGRVSFAAWRAEQPILRSPAGRRPQSPPARARPRHHASIPSGGSEG
jgi:hypothetical protein